MPNTRVITDKMVEEVARHLYERIHPHQGKHPWNGHVVSRAVREKYRDAASSILMLATDYWEIK